MNVRFMGGGWHWVVYISLGNSESENKVPVCSASPKLTIKIASIKKGMEMKIQTLRVARATVSLSAILGLIACVTPQIKRSSAPAQAAPTSQNSTGSAASNTATKPVVSPQPAQAAPINSVKTVENGRTATQSVAGASKNFQELLEKALVCAVKNHDLSQDMLRKTAISERLISNKPTKVEDKLSAYGVIGNLKVYGLKVTELVLEGNRETDGASVAVTLDAKMADVVMAYKNNKIIVKKSSFGPGLWNKRPNSMFTGVHQENGKLTMVCVDPMM